MPDVSILVADWCKEVMVFDSTSFLAQDACVNVRKIRLNASKTVEAGVDRRYSLYCYANNGKITGRSEPI